MLSRLGQVNHYYVDVYYADRWCGFPQSPVPTVPQTIQSAADVNPLGFKATVAYLSAKVRFSIERLRAPLTGSEMLLQNS